MPRPSHAASRRAPFSRVAIAGVGLIGGSLGLALKRAYPSIRICGIGRRRRSLELAERLGAIDEKTTDLAAGLAGADLVVLATPVKRIIELLAEIGPYLRRRALVTDVGSTKAEVCRAARKYLPDSVFFIGGHPLAGKERSGIELAEAGLFRGATYALCPLPGTPGSVLSALARAVRSMGAVPLVMDAALHDRVVARTSHLPQIISTTLALVLEEAARSESEQLFFQLSGGGFRDQLRLAASPYQVWRDIFETNSAAISQALADMVGALERVRAKLEAEGLEKDFDRANAFYQRYVRQQPDRFRSKRKL